MTNPQKTVILIISLLIVVSLLVSGGILIVKNNSSKAENTSNNRPTKEEKKPTPPQKDNPQPKPYNPPTPQSPPPQPIPKPNNPPQQNNNEYGAITASGREPEYKTNPPLPISSVGTGNDRPDSAPPVFNAGSALLTDTLDGSGGGSSILDSNGITHIIHAVNQPFTSFNNNEQRFIDYVVKSIQNSIILADRYKFERLAIPFVGGGIYLGSCDPQKLAKGIMKGAINQLEKCQHLQKIIFLDWHNDQTPRKNRQAFLTAFGKIEDEEGWLYRHRDGGVELAKNSTKLIFHEWGDIRDKNIHGASVIINAANTQVKFGSGISGAIAEQVGDKTKIETRAQELIGKFNHFPS